MEPDVVGSTRWRQHPRTMEDDSLDEDVSEGDQARSCGPQTHQRRRDERCPWTWASWKEAEAKKTRGEEGHEYESVDAVYPTTRRYFC